MAREFDSLVFLPVASFLRGTLSFIAGERAEDVKATQTNILFDVPKFYPIFYLPTSPFSYLHYY
jgi:hypothetical protein